ncbi:type II toxin-antitoxin system VapC family toxin [Candidatus Woesearchaeota archaeon]|nr:type II toxin-antitoxin system VapC family toxin [Candidatus Woesearchaeota archaeon]
MKILDSDILIALLKNDSAAKHAIAMLQSSGESLATTALTAHEVLAGTVQGGLGGRRYQTAQLLLRSLPVFVYDLDAVEHTVKLQEELTKLGRPIGVFDEMISGISLAHDATVVTRNLKHFLTVHGLNVETW